MDRKCRVEGESRALINRWLACGTDISVSMCTCGCYVCMGLVDGGWGSRCVYKLYIRWFVGDMYCVLGEGMECQFEFFKFGLAKSCVKMFCHSHLSVE